MQDTPFSFPQYRKYVGINTFFKIDSATKFIELSKIGGKLVLHEVEAIQYPEKLLIQDMLKCHENRWEVVSELDYKLFKEN